MRTITFYSYKGGVGRSLTLANMAMRLAEFGKSVCILDFDLEAPGMHHKFHNELTAPVAKGVVDYIWQYAHEGMLPNNIISYSTRLRLYNNENVHLIPAGNIEDSDYWRRLSSIDWYNLVYENPDSISFFLDLKQKIKKELNPDFLLIDSRTGISEMSGITISLLADEVIIVSANNKENLMGSRKIIDFLTNPEKSILGKVPKVSFVLSRIPLAETPPDRGREQRLVGKIKEELPNIKAGHFFILHSDRDLELDEEMRIGFDIEDSENLINKSVQITKEYLELFEHITVGALSEEEIIRFENLKKSEKLYKEGRSIPDYSRKIELFGQAVQLNPQNIDAQFALGASYLYIGKFEEGRKKYEDMLSFYPNQPSRMYNLLGHAYLKNNMPDHAIITYNKMLELFPEEKYKAFSGLGRVSVHLGNYDKAIEYLTIALTENSDASADLYNTRANIYRNLENYSAALDDVFNSLEINPENAAAYGTLAEIYASLGRIKEFYLNFENALSRNREIVAKSLPEEKIYSRFLKEQRFITLLEKYDVPVPVYE